MCEKIKQAGDSMSKMFLDCKGLSCPMPIVEIGRAFSKMNIGERLQVEADDPAFIADVEAWARKTQQKIVNIQQGDVKTVTIEKIES